ncbi:L,D-transpeptidase [Roseovarius sp. SK2]|uniref:L,D-transpeptidase n=1 Tax=Roseovarius TaxID=74030 RepID=UPI000CDD7ED7|nr:MULTISPECIES: L,D-transpeptidase [Roseovarius]MDD9727701.1 L,D-transpeptidase [Roseovarius sp. SK2]
MVQFLNRRMALRSIMGAGLSISAGPGLSQNNAEPDTVKRNISSFSIDEWQDHFDNLQNGAILCDTVSRALQFWSEDESIYKLYPTSVPMSEELTRRGYTRVVYKDPAPDWRPTPSMLERDPTLPKYVAPGPENPLGIRALRLSWQYYRIHGTQDTRKIGRRSSSGCIGLYNEHIVELFDLAKVGTQVKII